MKHYYQSNVVTFMKVFIITSILVLAILFTYKVFAKNNLEEQPYSIVKTYHEFEIRFYPTSTMATINSKSKNYKDLGSSGFRVLAKYIFGGNKENKSISMTAPVYMNINDTLSSMSFVMPKSYNEKKLPTPNDSNIIISKTDEIFVAVIKFSGFASDEKIKTNIEKLKVLLKENQISYFGNFNYLGYNPPFQLINRRNEIMVNVKWTN
ncbi:MAG: SOUL family heme-binding protein [Bacteroidia bacterium]